MNVMKRLLNVGLCAQIQNLPIDNNKKEYISGKRGNVYVLCRISYGGGYNFNKFCTEARSNLGTVSRDGNFFWRSKGFKTKEETIGYLTKEVRIAQRKFPEISFFKHEKYKEGEIVEFDEFLNNEWIRSEIKWCDAFSTMREYKEIQTQKK